MMLLQEASDKSKMMCLKSSINKWNLEMETQQYGSKVDCLQGTASYLPLPKELTMANRGPSSRASKLGYRFSDFFFFEC